MAAPAAHIDVDKRPTLLLHIGLDKTGTSALQQIFSQNTELLLESGILYSKTGRLEKDQHHDLFSRISFLGNALNYNYSRKTFSEHLDALKSELAGFKGHSVLLSSEMLSQGVDMAEMASLRKMFSSVTLIVYLRQQESYLASVYRQRVKAGTEYRNFDLSSLPTSDYFNLCRTWATFTQGGKFYARLYDEAKLKGKTVCSDFFDAIGHQDLVPKLAVRERNSNPRLTNDCMEFKRLVNASCPMALHKHLIQPLQLYSQDTSATVVDKFSNDDLLTKSKCAEIFELYRASNRQTATDFLGENKDLFELGVGPEVAPYSGLTEFTAMEIASNLVDCVADLPAEAHIQRALADGLSVISEELLPLISTYTEDNDAYGSRINFDEELLRKCLLIKTDLTRRCVKLEAH